MSDSTQGQAVGVDAAVNAVDARARAHGNAGQEVGAVAMASHLQIEPAPSGARAIMLALESDPEFVPLVAQAIKDGLRSMSRHWDKDAKGWVYEIDTRGRLASAQMYLQYVVGLPVARVEMKSISVQKPMDSFDVLRRSPAAREAARRALERAEKLAKEDAEEEDAR